MGKKKRQSRRRDSKSAQKSVSVAVGPFSDAIKADIEAWSEEAAEVVGVELVDVEFSTPGQWMIRVFVQREGNPGPGEGITIDQCAEVSRYVEALFEADSRMPERYLLEVSSPGIERNLKKPRHYHQVVGARVRVVIREAIEGQYAFEGLLKRVAEDDSAVVLELEGASGELTEMELSMSGIKRASTVYDFTNKD